MVGGRLRTTRFFKTWSGYREPVFPQEAVDLIAAQALSVYYACSFEEIAGRQVLVQFDKHRLDKRTIDKVDAPAALRSEPLLGFGGWVGTAPTPLYPMTPAGILVATEYLVLTKDDGAIHVRRTLSASRAYRYSLAGRFQDFMDLVRARD